MEKKCSVIDGECTECADFLSFMDQAQVFAQQKGDKCLFYDFNVAIGNTKV